MDKWLKRLADLSTTNLRITVSVALASLCVVSVLTAVIVGWAPSDQQLKALYAIGVLLSLMMGLDVAQFIGKRYSDTSLAAARNSAISGTVVTDPPAGTVEMTPKTPAAVVAVTPAPPPPSIAGGA